MEKLLAKIFTYSIQHSVQAIIYYQNVSYTKMKEFKILLDCFENIEKTLEDLIEIKQKFKSKRLLMLLNNKGGLLPSNIKESLIEFY